MVSATDDALIVANNSLYASGSAARSVSNFFRERARPAFLQTRWAVSPPIPAPTTMTCRDRQRCAEHCAIHDVLSGRNFCDHCDRTVHRQYGSGRRAWTDDWLGALLSFELMPTSLSSKKPGIRAELEHLASRSCTDDFAAFSSKSQQDPGRRNATRDLCVHSSGMPRCKSLRRDNAGQSKGFEPREPMGSS